MKITDGMRTYKRLLSASMNYWQMFALGVVGTLMLSGIDALFSWMIKPLINNGFVARNEAFIKLLPIGIVIIFAVRGLAGFASDYCISRVARNVVRDFRRLIFQKYLRMPAKYYDAHSSGYILATMVYNVEQLATASSDALITVLREASLFIGLIVVMFMLSWKLSLVFLLTAPFMSWVVKWSSRRMRRISTIVQESVGEVTHIVDEGIQGYKVIRLCGAQAHERVKFEAATKRNLQREMKIIVTKSVGTALIQSLISVPIAIALLCAVNTAFNVSAGTFAAVITSMVMILRPVRRLTNINNEIQKGVSGADSIFAVLDEEDEIDTGMRTLTRAKGNIEFKHVNFSYESSKGDVLHNINIQIKPNQTVAIVGRSGAGKSTLINLLPRFYDVKQGQILIDGVDVRDYTLAALRDQFAFVSQNTVLFNDTIFNNIAYGMPDVDERRVYEVAEAAYVADFVDQLQDGFQTRVGEDGVLLSGGQRQRLAIARALLKNAPILILDEATSSLDTQSERHIQEALDRLVKDRTTLVIAHRLSTIENADWIVVMDKGVVVEQGMHAELLARQGAYAALHSIQFKDVPAEISETV